MLFVPGRSEVRLPHDKQHCAAWIENASDEPFSAIDAINRMTLQRYLVDAWSAEPRTVIYVTHDIDEAVYLADRIAIMTPSPGRIAQYVEVDLERPRDRNSVEANRLRAEITEIMHRLENSRDVGTRAS